MSVLEKLMQRVGNAAVLDRPAKSLSKAVDKAISQPDVVDALSGKQLGHPLHPAMVLVPIGSFVSASVLDYVPKSAADRDAAQRLANRLIALGIASAVPTAAAGLSDWRYTSGPERRIGVVHALTNTLALSCYSASLIMRVRGRHATGKALSLLGGLGLSAGGYLGGHLAYANGVGVDTNAFGGGPKKWKEVAIEVEITDDFKVVDVDGTRVLLTRVGGEVVAIANRCSHRGAPLHEGKREGDCVVCPWHSSEFDLSNGEVNRGPAVRPQQGYEVRVREGKVEVRHRSDHGDLATDIDLTRT